MANSIHASTTGPPPTPTSLLGLPKAWLLALVTYRRSRTWDECNAVLALFRTCTFFRDLVWQQHKASLQFKVPIAAKDFSGEVGRLCTVARRSDNIKLEFSGPREDADQYRLEWTETEPYITHLLVCAMAQLGGQPLTCIKELHLQFLKQTAFIPAWVKVLCPNVVKVCCVYGDIIPRPLQPALAQPQTSSTSATLAPPPPLTCQHLRELQWYGPPTRQPYAAVTKHMQQQLAALPSLSQLTLDYRGEGWDARNLINSTVTHLKIETSAPETVQLQSLHLQFPNLTCFIAEDCGLNDAGLESLLSLPRLGSVSVDGLALQRSHAHRSFAWRELEVSELDVDSFARLPLEHIVACRVRYGFKCSKDVQAVQRVVSALRRWRTLSGLNRFTLLHAEHAALLTTLPLLTPVLADAG